MPGSLCCTRNIQDPDPPFLAAGRGLGAAEVCVTVPSWLCWRPPHSHQGRCRRSVLCALLPSLILPSCPAASGPSDLQQGEAGPGLRVVAWGLLPCLTLPAAFWTLLTGQRAAGMTESQGMVRGSGAFSISKASAVPSPPPLLLPPGNQPGFRRAAGEGRVGASRPRLLTAKLQRSTARDTLTSWQL